MHDISKCEQCLWNQGIYKSGCLVFRNRERPILNKQGECSARIIRLEQFRKKIETLSSQEYHQLKRRIPSIKKA